MRLSCNSFTANEIGPGQFQIDLGFHCGRVKTDIVCVDSAKLDRSFVGRVIDEELLAQLPLKVDHAAKMLNSIRLLSPKPSVATLSGFGTCCCRNEIGRRWICSNRDYWC